MHAEQEEEVWLNTQCRLEENGSIHNGVNGALAHLRVLWPPIKDHFVLKQSTPIS